jgi:dTDP-4-dehydrorhamnose reductase
MQRKILVFGAGGQVGHTIMRRAGEVAIGFDHASVDIADTAAVSKALRMHTPLAIVNAAGYTAVDRAESDPETAFRVNRDGAMVLAVAARAANVPLVQVSTDYVFDGKKRMPYREDDPVGPLNVYGKSKAEGERVVRSAGPQHIILRTSWVFSPYGTNFVRTMLRLAVEREELNIVDDQTGCPTAAEDLADAILSVLAKANEPRFTGWGTYHYRGGNALTWHGFAKLMFGAAARYGQRMPRLVPVESAAFRGKAERPAYSVLSTTKIAEIFGIEPRPLSDSLGECLDVLLAQKVL